MRARRVLPGLLIALSWTAGAGIAHAEQVIAQKPLERRFPQSYCPFETRDVDRERGEFGLYFTATGPTATIHFEAENLNEFSLWNAHRIDNIVVAARAVFEANSGVPPGFESCYTDPLPGWPSTGSNAPAFFFDRFPIASYPLAELFDTDPTGDPGRPWDMTQGAYYVPEGDTTDCQSLLPKAGSAPRSPETGTDCSGGSLGLGSETAGDVVARTTIAISGLTAGEEYIVTGWWDCEDFTLANPLTITVVGAGCGLVEVDSWGSGGVGPGEFQFPTEIAVAPNGTVYVVDSQNYRVQYFTSLGGYLGEWGEYGAGDGQFQDPAGVTVDPSGFVYVADRSRHLIQKFTNSGTYVTKWGSFGSANGLMNYPNGIAADGSGFVYVADQYNYRVQKFTGTGGFVTKWGSEGSGPGQFENPFSVAVSPSQEVFVGDNFGNRVQRFTNTGTYVNGWSTPTPRGIAVDGSGNVLVTDFWNARLRRFGPTGNFLGEWIIRELPFGVATNLGQGGSMIYVADYHFLHRVVVFAPPEQPAAPAVLSVYTGQTGTWKSTAVPPAPGWNTDPSFDDCTWGEPVAVAPSPLVPAQGIWHSGASDCSPAPSQVWFRGRFSLASIPSRVELEAAVDDDGDIYLNGTLVASSADCFASSVGVHDVTSLLQVGENLVAVRALDCGACHNLQLVLRPDVSGVGDSQRHVRVFPGRPNPFSSDVTFGVEVPTDTRVEVEVFDILGRRVRRIVPGTLPRGAHALTWDGRDEAGGDLGAGIYLVRVHWPGHEAANKVVKIR